MKKYEILQLDIQNISDVITTSGDVTTEEIPWQTPANPAIEQFFELD
jgi:hypothetical protein